MQELANLMALRHFKQLKYDGYELETMYNVKAKNHREAMAEAFYNTIEDLEEVVLHMLHKQLDDSDISNFIYEIVRKNAYNEAKTLAGQAIDWVETNFCNW